MARSTLHRPPSLLVALACLLLGSTLKHPWGGGSSTSSSGSGVMAEDVHVLVDKVTPFNHEFNVPARTHTGTARRPRIFMYQQAERFKPLRYPSHHIRRHFYSVDLLWPDLLRASPYVTTNPDEADYFYYEIYLYYGKDTDVNAAVSEMRAFGPYWDRKKGADHIFIVADDVGGCMYSNSIPEASIVLHHFGKVFPMVEPNPCKVFDTWGDRCDPFFLLQEERARGAERQPCHHMNVDIVTPPTYVFEDPKNTPYTNPERQRDKSTTFFFAGAINLHDTQPEHRDHPETDAYYSWGVRQNLYRMFNNTPGFKFFPHHVPNYLEEIAMSKFCLAPAGFGWGGRMKASALAGCVPVIIQPGIKVEFEEQLPMFDYAIRLPTSLMHELPEILDALERSGKYAKMARALSCAWRFHWWSHPVGRAFDLVICELKARLYGRRVELNTETCHITCGDGEAIHVPSSQPYMV